MSDRINYENPVQDAKVVWRWIKKNAEDLIVVVVVLVIIVIGLRLGGVL